MENRSGIVLIIVLWALVALMIIAVELGRVTRLEGLSAGTYEQEVVAYYIAVAGLNRAIYTIVQSNQSRSSINGAQQNDSDTNSRGQDECPDPWLIADGQWKDEPYGAGGYQVRVSDESAKININTVDEISLRETFRNLDLDSDLGDSLADAILDWRDPNGLERLNGVESDYYLSQEIPYPSKDAPLDTIDELLLVRDVSQELFYGTLKKVFTVYGNARTGNMINPRTANPLVIRATQGIDSETAEELIRQRQEYCGKDVMDAASVLGNLPTVVTIDSVGYLTTGSFTRRLAGVIDRGGSSSFRILRWQDRLPSHELPIPHTSTYPNDTYSDS